ncbi:nose resistant to fluoxetine protein 6, partial [Ixodes scapularis]
SAIQRLSSLSAYETARKLLVVRAPKDEDSRRLQVFHGLRALSIIWVVWVHHYAYNDISVYSGAKMAKKLVVQYNTQLFNNGWLAVDTFFFVSAKESSPTKGPQLGTLDRQTEDSYAYPETLGNDPPDFPGTIVKTPSGKLRGARTHVMSQTTANPYPTLCLVPYWYISVDTQLQILFIGFVVLLFRRTYLALFLMGLMVMAGVGVVMAQTLVNDYQPTALFVAGDLLFSKHLLSELYFRPYTHFGPFCLGIVVAYAFVSKLTQHSIGKVFQAVCWAVSLCSGATILFCTKEWGSGDVPPPWVSAAYAGTHRLVWGLCLAWIVVACVSGRG